MKRCSRCGQSKMLAEFRWKNEQKGLLRSECRPCQDEYGKAWHQAQGVSRVLILREQRQGRKAIARQYVDQLKATTPCPDCGEKKIPELMDFDHVRGEKKFTIAQMVHAGFSVTAIQQEIAKCEIVCARCHARRTARRRRQR